MPKFLDVTSKPAARAALDLPGYLGLNILDYGVTTGTSSSQTTAIKTAFDANPGKAFFFPPGDYRLDTTLNVTEENSITLAAGARIYAAAAMTNLINWDNEVNYTSADVLAQDKFIVGRGTLDGAMLAENVLRVNKVLRFTIEGLLLKDGIGRGILLDTIGAETQARNLRIINTTTTNVSDNVGIECRMNDNYFHNITMRDLTVGVWDKGANDWSAIHPWLGESTQVNARYENSVAFKLAGDSVLTHCFADTYRSAFQSAQTAPSYAVARIVAPTVYTAPGNLTNSTAASFPGVVFDFDDSAGQFRVTHGRFVGHPTTNHAFTAGSSKRLSVKDTLYSSNVTGYTGADYLNGVKLGVGSFTPIIFGSSVAGTQTYTYQWGRMEVRDGMVSYQFIIRATLGSTIDGNIRIGGLLLPDGAASVNAGAGSLSYSAGGIRASGLVGANGSSNPLTATPVVVDGGITDLIDGGTPSTTAVTTIEVNSVPLRNASIEVWGQINCTFNYQS